MLSDTIRQLARAHGMVPRGALAYRGQRGTLTLDLELQKVPTGYGATLTLSPADPHELLFATPRPTWLLDSEVLLVTGDRAFDEAVALRAPPELFGLFDHVHRRAFVMAIGKGDAIIDAGRLIASLDRLSMQEAQLLVALGHRLCLGREAAANCLRHIAGSDPHPAVRERARSYSRNDAEVLPDGELEPSAAELRARVGDTQLDPISRITAFAKVMRDLPWSESAALIAEARDAILALSPDSPASSHRSKIATALEWLLTELQPRFFDEDLEPHAGAMLLASLWGVRRHLPHDISASFGLLLARLCEHVARPELQPCILSLLKHPSREVRFVALSALDKLDLDAETLIGMLTPEHHLSVIELSPELAEGSRRGGPLLEVAFRVSFRFPLPAEKRLRLITTMAHLTEVGEPFLWDRLEATDSPTREAALEVLGARGTSSSLPYLQPLTTGLFRPASTKALARAAIASIIERHGPIEVGGLSLSGDTPGALTLSDHSKL